MYNHEPVYYLAESLRKMAEVDAVYLAANWEKARGCRIEKQVAEEYGIKILKTDFIEPYVSESVKIGIDYGKVPDLSDLLTYEHSKPHIERYSPSYRPWEVTCKEEMKNE